MDLYMYGWKGINCFTIIAFSPDERIDWDWLFLLTPRLVKELRLRNGDQVVFKSLFIFKVMLAFNREI